MYRLYCLRETFRTSDYYIFVSYCKHNNITSPKQIDDFYSEYVKTSQIDNRILEYCGKVLEGELAFSAEGIELLIA